MRAVASIFVLCTILSSAMADPLWKVFCQGTPLYRGQADPIVNPGALAQHSHKVFGGSAFDYGDSSLTPQQYYDQIFASKCTTCSITIDNSVYWVPDLYYKWDNGSISLVPNGGLTIYYPSRSGSGNQTHPNWKPIPKGLRIVAGQSTRRSYNSSIVSNKAVSYACLSNPGGPETGEFPTATRYCVNGLRAQVWFPMCWDGVNLDSKDHFSHMSYPIGAPDGGNCPDTHPVRIPGIFFELLFSVADFPHGQGVSRFVWSNGDVTGNGLHGDFLNGWDATIMAAALADPSCDASNTNNGNSPQNCAPFTQYVKKDNPDQSCKIEKSLPGYEDLGINRLISHLPGCNPISGGGANVQACTGSWPQSQVDSKLRVAIRASNGLYATSTNTTNNWVASVAQAALSYSEMYTLVPQQNGLWAIQSEITQQFCSDNKRGATPLLFNRGSPSGWEFFNITYTNGDKGPTQSGAKVTITANSNGNYVQILSDGSLQSNASSSSASSATFYLVDPDAGVQDTRTSKNGFNTPAAAPTAPGTPVSSSGATYDSSSSYEWPSSTTSPSPSSAPSSAPSSSPSSTTSSSNANSTSKDPSSIVESSEASSDVVVRAVVYVCLIAVVSLL
eukprot:TRINITY_DN1335_c0_g2_i1.p1 TRINITY_DN1335_c0_g2~~TRINITY_DN1335_c0_g2_i1.p1  ORF type:complete len:616 (-),score=180.05 TRINITY_DN1335_c0_g2_i1:6-1853(-)